ncbi:MAG: cytochrome c3 family protein [Acidobacteria bacterium]|nr:cytochrome c3 family protein [Acidobacteriota bacterium]
MPQVFRRRADLVVRGLLVGVPLAGALLVGGLAAAGRSSYVTEVGEPRPQPVPFSHQHHVAGLGIDCRYCHTSVETSAFAGMPPSSTCMSCHSQVWADSPLLEPVRESLRSGNPLHWTRVNDLPDFVYFDHSIHVSKGIGCATCHGRVDRMPLMWRGETLFMKWCLECHREPERYVRPRSEVFNMEWQAPPDQLAAGRKLAREYGIKSRTDCITCHR